jgi:5-methylthioribose kinase
VAASTSADLPGLRADHGEGLKLDIEQPDSLLRYLREYGHINEDECPQFRVLRGGVSNRTVWVGRAGGEEWVLKQALPKLRVAVEWLSPPERIGRESLGMRWLARVLPEGTLPRFVFEDLGQYLLCMTAVPEPHRNWKAMLLDNELIEDYVDQFALILAAIHGQRSPAAAEAFAETSFFESLRLEPYYLYTAAQVPEAADFLHALTAETRQTKLSIVHGDYSPKNILVHNDRLVLLDEEVIHFGDPAFDVGFSLTHLLSKAHHLREHRPLFAAAAKRYWGEYARDTSIAESIEGRAVRHTLACLLARVDGRSPLEYLNETERNSQRTAAVTLMADPPRTIPKLIDAFLERLP